MDLTTATPAEIDTVLAEMYDRLDTANYSLDLDVVSVMYKADAKKVGYPRARWNMTVAAAVEAVRKAAAEDTTYRGMDAKRTIDRYDASVAAVTAATAEIAPLEAEFRRRGGWTRAFLALATNGHVHNGRDCSTCNNGESATRFAWFPQYSGQPEAEIVADAGYRACTTCYPTAPVGDAKSLPTKFFSKDERTAAQARIDRDVAKAARLAKKIEKGLTADGSEFVVTYTTVTGGHDRIPGTRQTEYVVRPRERREHFKTEQAAIQWVVQYTAWNSVSHTPEIVDGFTQVIEAVAAKHGQTVEEVRKMIAAKVAAKVKRDNR